ncbi:hypothetical protein TNCT_690871 [Trichonephila clavata]|uniref:Uncharacterized protein n=1 Tax=Trichonephila clavata TaxID=2740835 RepID=A0A8X6GJL6_TRICU|nr:hypothetical protein TNCT_690871 [Trichonephila clavata]
MSLILGLKAAAYTTTSPGRSHSKFTIRTVKWAHKPRTGFREMTKQVTKYSTSKAHRLYSEPLHFESSCSTSNLLMNRFQTPCGR